MTGADGPVLELLGVRKQYGGLRPLRIQELRVGRGQTVALLGLDAPAAEVFVNLVTGSTVPDEGDVRVFGRSTTAISDSTEWLAFLDRFGILSDRAVLLEGLTVAQNLAMTLTLQVDPIAADVRRRVEELAVAVGIAPELHDQLAGVVPPAARVRVRLGRAVALGAEFLVLEHPTATLDAGDTAAFAADLRRLGSERGLTMVAATADRTFATALRGSVLTHVPATGAFVRDEGVFTAMKRWLGRV